MSQLSHAARGRRGFLSTTKNHFCGVEKFHKNWLVVHAQAVYAENANRPGFLGGKFPPRVIHPSRLSEIARYIFYCAALAVNDCQMVQILHVNQGYLSDDELMCIQACLYGSVSGRVPF